MTWPEQSPASLLVSGLTRQIRCYLVCATLRIISSHSGVFRVVTCQDVASIQWHDNTQRCAMVANQGANQLSSCHYNKQDSPLGEPSHIYSWLVTIAIPRYTLWSSSHTNTWQLAVLTKARIRPDFHYSYWFQHRHLILWTLKAVRASNAFYKVTSKLIRYPELDLFQISHLFFHICNIEQTVNICTIILELKVGMLVGNYWLSAVTGRRAPGRWWSARTWITDPKVYPVYHCSNDGVRSVEDSGGYSWPFC